MSSSSIFPDNLKDLVHTHYAKAIESGSVLFNKSETVIIPQGDINYEACFAPSLLKKPPAAGDKPSKTLDPFSEPFEPHMLITEARDDDPDDDEQQEYILVLNKFCVSPYHTILATKDFRPQNQLPSRSELYTLYSLLNDPKTGFNLGFYNCGPDSGASQPHKHFQLLALSEEVPLNDIIMGFTPPKKNAVFSLPANIAPYAHYIVHIDKKEWKDRPTLDAKKDYLIALYMSLLDRAIENARQVSHMEDNNNNNTDNEGPQDMQVDGNSNNQEQGQDEYIVEPVTLPRDKPFTNARDLSYNLVVTKGYMELVPRRSEKVRIVKKDSQDEGRQEKRMRRSLSSQQEHEQGQGQKESSSSSSSSQEQEIVSINSLGYAGMVLVKTEGQKRFVQGSGIVKILSAVGWENGLTDEQEV